MVQYITYFNNELKSALAAKLKLTLATGSHNWWSKKTKRYLLAQNFCLIAMNIAQVWKLRNGDYHLRCVLVQLVYFYHTIHICCHFFLPKNLRRRGSQKDPTEGWKWLNCAAFLLDYHHNNKRCCCERFHIRWKILVGR